MKKIQIELTRAEYNALKELCSRGGAYTDLYHYKDWRKMEKIEKLIRNIK